MRIDQDTARALLQRALAHSRAEACTARLAAGTRANLRFARNTVTTSGHSEDVSISITAQFGQRTGTATINELDDAALAEAVRRAEQLARLAPEDPEALAPLGPQEYLTPKAYFASTAARGPADRATDAATAIALARKQGLVAAGFLEDRAWVSAMMTSNGLFGYFPETVADFNLTVRTPEGDGSGYATMDVNDAAHLDAEAVARRAVEKASRSKGARALPPGPYTVVLEPAASVGLLKNLVFHLDARAAEEGRSFLSRPGGGTRLGEALMDARVTLRSAPDDPAIPFTPWAEDGTPHRPTAWIDRGVVEHLGVSRFWAARRDRTPTPLPPVFALDGTDAPLADLIADTPRGLLVTRTWYIRSVDPRTLLYTGLTRDGLFLIENGKVTMPVKNFRFNESPVRLLQNIDALGRPARVDGCLIPPMRVRDFAFTSPSEAV